jgi:lipoprotein-releasing system permease protein
VVVLERFARVARSPLRMLVCGAVVAVVAALIALQLMRPELASGARAAWLAALWPWLGAAAAVVVVAMIAVRQALARLGSARVARVVVVWAAAAAGVPFVLAVSGEGELARSAWRLLGLSGLGLVALGLLPLAMAGFLDMRGSAEWFIATRYMVARRRQVFISAITAICIVGIAACVWLIIVVLSVMNGFEQTWRDEILGDRAHFVVEDRRGSIDDWPGILKRVGAVEGVVAASPYLDADAMVRGRGGEIYSVRVRGVDPELVGRVTSLRDDVVMGSLDDVLAEAAGGGSGEDADEPAAPGILIGSQLASALGVGVADDLLVISPFGGPPTPLGPAPRLARFRVVGVFRSSFYQYDEVYAYVSIPAAQAFRRAGGIDGIEGITTDYYRSQRVGAAIAAELGEEFRIRDWKEYFPAFFQALKTERIMMFLLLSMIMVVAAFVIVATLIMMIMEKSSDIAILKAMGAEDALIERIFALEGTLIGLVGTALGVVAGLAVTHRLGWIQAQIEGLTGIDALPSSVYQFSSLPSRVDPLQVGIVVGIAMVLSLGATLLPSRQGARIDPAEGLRHE